MNHLDDQGPLLLGSCQLCGGLLGLGLPSRAGVGRLALQTRLQRLDGVFQAPDLPLGQLQCVRGPLADVLQERLPFEAA